MYHFHQFQPLPESIQLLQLDYFLSVVMGLSKVSCPSSSMVPIVLIAFISSLNSDLENTFILSL